MNNSFRVTAIFCLLWAMWAPSASAQSAPALSEALQKYNAGNYAGLSAETASDAQDGHFFYKEFFARQCASYRMVNDAWQANKMLQPARALALDGSAQTRARALLSQRCAGFEKPEMVGNQFRHPQAELLRQQGKQLQDPLVLAGERDVALMRAREARHRDATAALPAAVPWESADPLFVESRGLRPFVTSDNPEKKVRYLINGQQNPLDGTIDYGFAVYLVPCKLGFQCDATEFNTALECASGQSCDDARVASVKRKLAMAGRPETFQVIDAVADQLAQTIRAEATARAAARALHQSGGGQQASNASVRQRAGTPVVKGAASMAAVGN